MVSRQKAEGRIRTDGDMLRGHRDLNVFQLAYKLVMEIFNESKRLSERRALIADRGSVKHFVETILRGSCSAHCL